MRVVVSSCVASPLVLDLSRALRARVAEAETARARSVRAALPRGAIGVAEAQLSARAADAGGVRRAARPQERRGAGGCLDAPEVEQALAGRGIDVRGVDVALLDGVAAGVVDRIAHRHEIGRAHV